MVLEYVWRLEFCEDELSASCCCKIRKNSYNCAIIYRRVQVTATKSNGKRVSINDI